MTKDIVEEHLTWQSRLAVDKCTHYGQAKGHQLTVCYMMK